MSWWVKDLAVIPNEIYWIWSRWYTASEKSESYYNLPWFVFGTRRTKRYYDHGDFVAVFVLLNFTYGLGIQKWSVFCEVMWMRMQMVDGLNWDNKPWALLYQLTWSWTWTWYKPRMEMSGRNWRRMKNAICCENDAFSGQDWWSLLIDECLLTTNSRNQRLVHPWKTTRKWG